MVARGEVAGGLGEKGEGTKKYKWQLQKSHGDGKYSTGDIVNNIITLYGARRALETSGGTLCKVYDCLTLCCPPETNKK